MGEGTGRVDQLPSPSGRGVGGEGYRLLSVNQARPSHPKNIPKINNAYFPYRLLKFRSLLPLLIHF